MQEKIVINHVHDVRTVCPLCDIAYPNVCRKCNTPITLEVIVRDNLKLDNALVKTIHSYALYRMSGLEQVIGEKQGLARKVDIHGCVDNIFEFHTFHNRKRTHVPQT